MSVVGPRILQFNQRWIIFILGKLFFVFYVVKLKVKNRKTGLKWLLLLLHPGLNLQWVRELSQNVETVLGQVQINLIRVEQPVHARTSLFFVSFFAVFCLLPSCVARGKGTRLCRVLSRRLWWMLSSMSQPNIHQWWCRASIVVNQHNTLRQKSTSIAAVRLSRP